MIYDIILSFYLGCHIGLSIKFTVTKAKNTSAYMREIIVDTAKVSSADYSVCFCSVAPR